MLILLLKIPVIEHLTQRLVLPPGTAGAATEQRVRKKKSRWGGSENDKTFIPGMPTILPASLDSHQQEAYLGDYCSLHTFSIKFATCCLYWGQGESVSNITKHTRNGTVSVVYACMRVCVNVSGYCTPSKRSARQP